MHRKIIGKAAQALKNTPDKEKIAVAIKIQDKKKSKAKDSKKREMY